MAVSRTLPLPSYRIIVLAIIVLGALASVISYRDGRHDEEQRAASELSRRASLRHALTLEVLRRYEDSLFGLSTLFMLDANVTRAEFMRATSRLEERITGAQAFEWVPAITHENRATYEAAMQRSYRRPFEIIEYDPAVPDTRAADRPIYFPIGYIQPLRGNQKALGRDLLTAPTRPFLEHARETRQMTITSQVRLVQERADQFGVIMIWPVYRAGRPSPAAAAAPATSPEQPPAATPAAPATLPDVFIGFLQSVFRVRDLLETAHARLPDAILDALFIDATETDPAKRALYYRPADDTAPRSPMPTDEEFRRGQTILFEHTIPVGGRQWRVYYRPRSTWLAQQYSSTPLLRSCSLLLLSGLLAGLVSMIGRRTDTIRHEVAERTAELAESRRQFANMLHALPGMAYRCDYDEQLTVLFVSEGALELTGWTADELINGSVHFRDCIHPDDLARVRDATRAALQEHNDVEVEYRIRTRSGAEKWVLSRGRGVYTATGELTIFEGLAIDITAQKNAENARLDLERKLLEGQKLESLGLLAGGIAHDFNNLLSTILGNTTIVRGTVPASAGAEPQLRAIESAALRAAELCRQMLAYAGKGRFVIEPADLTVLTEELLPLLKISIGQHATLRLELGRSLPPVRADATQLRQIVMNLVLNAADAIGESGGEITLTTGVVQADHAMLAACVAGAGLPGGNYVFLEVRDTGCGMPPDVLAKIFDPFFTTKFAGRGLGLAAVLGIVRGHHGALRVESTPGRGSSFRLLLPPAAAPAPVARVEETAPVGAWRRAGGVLVIEDEEPVRVVTMEILKTFGFTPRGAEDGKSGVALFRENPGAFDLVLLDLLMPGMSGEQTLAALREVKPDVRVLLMSGYSEGDILGRLGNGQPLGFIPKPFTRGAFERKLREMLG